MLTKSTSSPTCHARADPVDGHKEQEQGMQRFVCMMACSVCEGVLLQAPTRDGCMLREAEAHGHVAGERRTTMGIKRR